jgi:hypothetical protein
MLADYTYLRDKDNEKAEILQKLSDMINIGRIKVL